PLPDTAQVFASQGLARDAGCSHQGLADTGVHILLEAALPACVLPETSLGIAGAVLLEALTARMEAGAGLPEGGATQRFAITLSSEVDDAQVNAQHIQGPAVWRGFVWRFTALGDMQGDMRGDMQRVDAAPPDQVSSADLPGWVHQHLMLAR